VQLPCSPALAFLSLWPPSPLATIHGSFASPGTGQCHENGINASFICIFTVSAPLAAPGSARRRQCLAAQNSGAQNSAMQSGLLVGVRAPRQCPLADEGVVKGRQCTHVHMQAHTQFLYSAWATWKTSASTKHLCASGWRGC